MRTLILSALAALSLTACVTSEKTPKFEVNSESVNPGTAVKRGDKSVALSKGDLKLNQTLPAVALTDDNWQAYTFKGDGRVKVVSFVPSVDTKVCEQQTHILGESTALSPKVERVTVSRDLPAAQKRFETESSLNNMLYLSDYKNGAFASKIGLLMEDSGLIARAVAVVDGQGKVRYLQVVPQLGQLPDMEKAISVANELAR